MSAKIAPRPFAATRHVGADQRAAASTKAATPAAQKTVLKPGALRRSGGMESLDTLVADSAGQSHEHQTGSNAGSQPSSAGSTSTPGARTIDSAASLESVRVGDTVFVNTQLIAENPMNAREFYRMSEVDATGQSISANKQDVAAGGWIDGGRVFLIDGGKRLRGARSVSVPYLKVEIVEKPTGPLEAWLKSRRMNLERSTQTVYDDAVRFAEVLKTKVVESQAALAIAVSEPGQPMKTDAYINQIVGVSLIPRSLMARLIDIPALCTKNAAVEISRLFKKDGLARLAELSEDGSQDAAMEAAERLTERIILSATANPEMTASDVRAIVVKALGESSRAVRVKTSTEATRFGQWQAKLTMVPDHKVLRVEFNDVPENEIEGLRARLKSLLEGERTDT
jgi:ParB family chromosome partitioning protein